MLHESSGHLDGQGGLKLFYRTWTPVDAQKSIVLVHGMNEHIGRYDHVARYFADRGFAVYGLDHRGYGQSEGPRCYVNRFEEYIEDLDTFVHQVAGAQGKPIMIGHSLGGLISFRYALAHPDDLLGLVVSSPGFGAKIKPDPVTKLLAPLLSAITPRMSLAVPFKPENVTRDEAIAKAYGEDPLVLRNATPRWYLEMTRAQAALPGLTASMRLPVLFLQAGDDLLVDPDATRAVFQLVPHDRKAFKLYPGKYHEIFNDPGREEVFDDILRWLREQEIVQAL